MKKYLISLVLFISIFIGFSNVKAESIPTDFGNVQFDFTTFITQNNLTGYNYYSIVMRNNQQVPVLTLYKNKPNLIGIGWGITLKDPQEEEVLLYTYNFNNNTWSSANNNENGQFSSRNVIYSSNFESVLYNGNTIYLVKNNNYYSFIKSYDSNFSKTLTYNNYSTTITYNSDNNSIVFDNINDNFDGSIQITKNYWYLIIPYNNYVIQLLQSDTPLYLINYSTENNSDIISSSSSNVVNPDIFLYNISMGAIGDSFSFGTTYTAIFNKFFSNTTSFRYLNASQLILHTGDLLDSLGNVISSANVGFKVVNKVIDLGDNTFGFYQDYLGLNLTSLTGSVDTLSVVCEETRPFNNNYCYINYNDLINHNSNISVFNDYGVSFTQLFGDNTGYLLNDRYYLYSFRIQKPFVPQVGNLFINSLTNNSNQVNILGVYLQDGGSYTDYVVKFKISNSNYTSSTSLNDIMVVFRDGLSNYFTTIPTSFNYSVYRSFKLQYFSTEPTMEQVNNFYNSRDLSTIDGLSSNNSFFTDNDFNTYGFGGIVTAPFRLLYAIENYQTCTDIVLPFPHSNDNITLKCVRNTIPSSVSPLITILQLVLSGFICYRIAVETLSVIKDISNPEKSNIEVVDL